MNSQNGHDIELVDGGLAICKRCHGGESDLEEPCAERLAKQLVKFETEIKALRAIHKADNEYFGLIQARAMKSPQGPPTESDKQEMTAAWGKCLAVRASATEAMKDKP